MTLTQSLNSTTSIFLKHHSKHLKIAVTTPNVAVMVTTPIKILVWIQLSSSVSKMESSVKDVLIFLPGTNLERHSQSMTKIS